MSLFDDLSSDATGTVISMTEDEEAAQKQRVAAAYAVACDSLNSMAKLDVDVTTDCANLLDALGMLPEERRERWGITYNEPQGRR